MYDYITKDIMHNIVVFDISMKTLYDQIELECTYINKISDEKFITYDKRMSTIVLYGVDDLKFIKLDDYMISKRDANIIKVGGHTFFIFESNSESKYILCERNSRLYLYGTYLNNEIITDENDNIIVKDSNHKIVVLTANGEKKIVNDVNDKTYIEIDGKSYVGLKLNK